MDGFGTYTTGGPTTVCFDLDGLVRLHREATAERDRLDGQLVAALRGCLAGTRDLPGAGVDEWARRFGVSLEEMLDVLAGMRPPSWRLWDGVGRYFRAGLPVGPARGVFERVAPAAGAG